MTLWRVPRRTTGWPAEPLSTAVNHELLPARQRFEVMVTGVPLSVAE
jgi:hypothetical protein